eukprot:NODE_227_length_12294_cov_1.542681.p5 type:complete len:279 gc:universal NODE_227_length_12294_cov_1.542681:1807-971(-)
MIFNILISAASLITFGVQNSTANITQDLAQLGIVNASKVTTYCSGCRNSTGTFGPDQRNARDPAAYSKGSTIFLIIQHNATYEDTDAGLGADGLPRYKTELYTSQHLVDVDTYSVLWTVAQRNTGIVNLAVFQCPGGKNCNQYLATSNGTKWFQPFNSDVYVQSSRTISLKFKKGILNNMYWQKPIRACSQIDVDANHNCIDNYKAEKCVPNVDPDSGKTSDPICPIKFNVVFEGTDSNGKLMESAGNCYLFRIFRCQVYFGILTKINFFLQWLPSFI